MILPIFASAQMGRWQRVALTEGKLPRTKLVRDIGKARTLRAKMSLPEVLLWQHLRQQDEAKFRRQHPIGPYVLDFDCPRAKVCVEIDEFPMTWVTVRCEILLEMPG